MALERDKVQDNILQPASGNHFDRNSCLRLIPKFNVTEVDVFFEAFERIAEEMKWPQEKWTLLTQGSLEGKAQEAYAVLDSTQGKDYDVVKKNALAAYELVPEAYRQQFRSLKRKSDESFLELAKRQELVFGRWLASTETITFESVCALVLMEQFKKCVPQPIEIYLNEQDEKDLRKAATLVDQYEVTHRSMSDRGKSFRRDREAERDSYMSGKNGSAPSESKRGERAPQTEVYSFYCKKPAHTKSVCCKLQNREAKPVPCVGVRPQVLETTDFVDPSEEEILKDYKGCVSHGAVALSENGQEVPVKVLRDSGASHSLLLKEVLELPPSTATGVSVVVKGVGDCYFSAPKHSVFVKTELVTKVATVGIVNTLPLKGITLLGNDLAGTRVHPSDPEDAPARVGQNESVTLIVLEQPWEAPQTVILEKDHPEVFVACVVTRSGSRSQELVDVKADQFLVDV